MSKTIALSYNQNQLATICNLLVDRVDEIVEITKSNLVKEGNMYVGACPIHCGDNKSAFNLYIEGRNFNGYWCCHTHKCHKIFAPNMIGYIRAMLSNRHKDYNWRNQGDPIYPFGKTLDWINKFLGEKIKELDKLTSTILSLPKLPEEPKGLNVNIIRERLKIPSPYFVKRGYPESVLHRYMIGYCDNKGTRQYKRSVVPVLNDDSSLMLSCTGRSIYEECPTCKLYHCSYYDCPKQQYASKIYCKWKNMGYIKNNLYNYWSAQKYIKKTKTVILVEGPADVWRLEQYGIRNSVALFGVSLTDPQSLILETSGAMNIVDMLDNDEAGRDGAAEIIKQTSRIYRNHRYNYVGHDPGELTAETVKPFKEFLEKLQ